MSDRRDSEDFELGNITQDEIDKINETNVEQNTVESTLVIENTQQDTTTQQDTIQQDTTTQQDTNNSVEQEKIDEASRENKKDDNEEGNEEEDEEEDEEGNEEEDEDFLYVVCVNDTPKYYYYNDDDIENAVFNLAKDKLRDLMKCNDSANYYLRPYSNGVEILSEYRNFLFSSRLVEYDYSYSKVSEGWVE